MNAEKVSDVQAVVERLSEEAAAKLFARDDAMESVLTEDDAAKDIARTFAPFAQLLEAAERMIPKLEQVAKDTEGIFVMAHIHGQNYKGANWSEEYELMCAALRGVREAAK